MWLGSEVVPSSSQTVIWTSQCHSLGVFTHASFLSERPEMEVYHPTTHISSCTCFSPILSQIWLSMPFPVPFSPLKNGFSLDFCPVRNDLRMTVLSRNIERMSAEGFLRVVQCLKMSHFFLSPCIISNQMSKVSTIILN